jgi:DNA polymerase II small subunit
MIDEDLLVELKEDVPAEKASKVKVVWSYDEPAEKRTYDSFVKSLQLRFKSMERILKGRQELSTVTSITRIRSKNDREQASLIAMVLDKQETANGNIMFTLEDMSGQIKALVNKSKQDIFAMAKDVQLDEILGFTGMGAGEIIFIDNIILPDIPLTKELKKAPIEEYAIFIGDPHFGSNVFLEDDFKRFLLWINGKSGNDEQKALANKVKYVFVTGDLIEGVGVYPGQEHDLAVQDITEQYELTAEYLRQIPQDKELIIFTGNHDAGRLSEPQEPMMRDYAHALYDLPNVTIVSNPAMVNIAATDHFPGFDCLLYHGGSFIYYADSIPSIRQAGGQKRSDLIMKHLLQRRHLASTHNAAMTIPTTDKDWLLIDHVPDFFITGHIHRIAVANYRNVTCVNAGCWTEVTEDQIKRGLEPQPGKLVLINLRTRGVKVMNFKKESSSPIARGSEQAKNEEQAA